MAANKMPVWTLTDARLAAGRVSDMLVRLRETYIAYVMAERAAKTRRPLPPNPTDAEREAELRRGIMAREATGRLTAFRSVEREFVNMGVQVLSPLSGIALFPSHINQPGGVKLEIRWVLHSTRKTVESYVAMAEFRVTGDLLASSRYCEESWS